MFFDFAGIFNGISLRYIPFWLQKMTNSLKYCSVFICEMDFVLENFKTQQSTIFVPKIVDKGDLKSFFPGVFWVEEHFNFLNHVDISKTF